MAEALIALLLVTGSANGQSLVYRWPPSPAASPRLARPRPDVDAPLDVDNPWRSFRPERDGPEDGADEYYADEAEEYEWRRPNESRDRSLSISHAATPSGRSTPSQESTYDFMAQADADAPHDRREYETVLGYSAEFLASLLCPQKTMCHQRFELVVDDLAFVGHPVCSDDRGVWRFKADAPIKTDTRGRGSKSAASRSLAQVDEVSDRSEGTSDTEGGQSRGRDAWLQTFHFVLVLDLPDPSSSASGNLAKYFDIIYEQIAFTVAAVLFQEQVLTNFVANECDMLVRLRDDYVSKAKPFSEYMQEALTVSSIGPAMKALFEAIKASQIAYLNIHGLPLELQLPPYLDTLLHYEEGTYEDLAALEDEEVNAWGKEMSFAWRLPTLAPWKSLLLLDGREEPELVPYMNLRGPHVNAEDRDLAEGLLKFLEIAQITLSLADMAAGLQWDLESQVYPTVRWLVQHRRAKVVDVVHEKLKTPFSLPSKFGAPLAELAAEFARTFGPRGIPSLPVLLATISRSTHKQTDKHFAAAVIPAGGGGDRAVRVKDYLDVCRWMLQRDLLVRLHLRIRVVAPPALKRRVRAERAAARARRAARLRGARGKGAARGVWAGRNGHGALGAGVGTGGSASWSVSMSRERVRGGGLGDDARSPARAEDAADGMFFPFSPRSARTQMRRRRLSSVGADLAALAFAREKSVEAEDDGAVGEEDNEEYGEEDEDEDEDDDDDDDDETLWEATDEDDVPTLICDPKKATPLERRWLEAMSDGPGRDVHPEVVTLFDQINQYFDGKKADDEILYRANITRRQLREVLHAYDDYLETFLHS